MVTNLKSKFQQEFRQSPIKIIIVLIALGTVVNWLVTDALRMSDEDAISDKERAEQAEYDKYCNSEKDRNTEICLKLIEKQFESN